MEEWRRRFRAWEKLIRVAVLILVVVVSLYVVNFLFWLLAPFVLALVFTLILRPLVRLFDRFLPLGRSFHVTLAMLVVIGAVLWGVVYLFSGLVLGVKKVTFLFPWYLEQAELQIRLAWNQVQGVVAELSPAVSLLVDRGVVWLGERLSDFSQQVVQFFVQVSFRLPEITLILIVAVVATYFLSVDYEKIGMRLEGLLPPHWQGPAQRAKKETVAALKGILRAQFIIFGATFIQLLVGFWLLGVKHPFLVASLVLIVDLIPIIGTGIVLVPWMLWSFLAGRLGIAVGLLLLYLVVALTRSLLTSKLYGQSVGLDPLTTLLAMYVGLKLTGFWGLILAPILLMIGLLFCQKAKPYLSQGERGGEG